MSDDETIGAGPSTRDVVWWLRNTPVESGSILPLTSYADNSTRFDPRAGFLGSIINAFTAPARAYNGQISRSEMIPEAVNFAGVASPGAAVSARVMSKPAQTIRTYHGTPYGWEGAPVSADFWSTPSQRLAKAFAQSPFFTDMFDPPSPAVMPLNVDTSRYLTVKPNSLLANKMSEATARKLAGALGYDGLIYQSMKRDAGEPVIRSIRNVGTVRSALSGGRIY